MMKDRKWVWYCSRVSQKGKKEKAIINCNRYLIQWFYCDDEELRTEKCLPRRQQWIGIERKVINHCLHVNWCAQNSISILVWSQYRTDLRTGNYGLSLWSVRLSVLPYVRTYHFFFKANFHPFSLSEGTYQKIHFCTKSPAISWQTCLTRGLKWDKSHFEKAVCPSWPRHFRIHKHLQF